LSKSNNFCEIEALFKLKPLVVSQAKRESSCYSARDNDNNFTCASFIVYQKYQTQATLLYEDLNFKWEIGIKMRFSLRFEMLSKLE